MKKWVNYSIFNTHHNNNNNNNSQNSNVNMNMYMNRKKSLVLNLWRFNACFDQSIATTAVQSLEVYEKLWKN